MEKISKIIKNLGYTVNKIKSVEYTETVVEKEEATMEREYEARKMYQFQARGKINKLCCFSLLLYMSHIAPSPLLSKFLFYKNSSSRSTMKNFTDTKHKINGKWCIVCFLLLYQRDEAILKRSFNNNFLYPIHSSCALILMSYALQCLFNTPATIS